MCAIRPISRIAYHITATIVPIAKTVVAELIL